MGVSFKYLVSVPVFQKKLTWLLLHIVFLITPCMFVVLYDPAKTKA